MARSKKGSKVRRIVRSNHTATALKVGLTATAFAAATYSNVLSRRISEARAVQLADESVSDDVAVAIRRQSVLRWVMPALSGGLMLIGAFDRNGRHSPSRVSRAIDRFDLKKLDTRVGPGHTGTGPHRPRDHPCVGADRSGDRPHHPRLGRRAPLAVPRLVGEPTMPLRCLAPSINKNVFSSTRRSRCGGRLVVPSDGCRTGGRRPNSCDVPATSASTGAGRCRSGNSSPPCAITDRRTGVRR